MSRIERAVQNGLGGMSCSESVLAAFGGRFGLGRDAAVRLASGFGGGMGLMGDTCGAVAASYMVLGLRYGSTEAEDAEGRMRMYALVGEFAHRFEARWGSTLCRDMMGERGVKIPEEWDKAREMGVLRSLCPEIVRNCAELLEEML